MVDFIEDSRVRNVHDDFTDESGVKIKLLESKISQLEEKLKRAALYSEETMKAKSDFLSSMSHEIRTPLNVVLGFSQWLQENTDNEEHREYLSAILMSAKSLSNLLNDILDLSIIESGKIKINNIPVKFIDLMNDISQIFQPKAKAKNLELKITTESSIPDCILIDEDRLYQIIFNLVSILIKQTSRGYIHITSYGEKITANNKINLVISIKTTGTAIQEIKTESVIEAFIKNSIEEETEQKGTGLEPAIAKGLIQKMNGTFQVNTTPNNQTNITVAFNGIKIDYNKNRLKETQKQEGPLLLAPCKIMIVDDTSYNIIVLKKLIGQKNVTFIEANNGVSALDKLKTETPDIIFMDIRMHGISGFETTKMIKQNNKLKQIPVIAYTGSAIHAENSKPDTLFDGFLQKPVFRENLETVLKQFLKHTSKPQLPTQGNNGNKVSEIPVKCLMTIPELLKKINTSLIPEWEKIKNTLLIFEVENFKNQIFSLAVEKSCNSILLQYHKKLESGLKSFDIELIKETIDDFPQFIRTIEGQYQEMIH